MSDWRLYRHKNNPNIFYYGRRVPEGVEIRIAKNVYSTEREWFRPEEAPKGGVFLASAFEGEEAIYEEVSK